ncbi:MAG: UvrB/UvrC motif-containing protein [Isosphaeraceae bacterium]
MLRGADGLSKDITPILGGWDHDPNEIQVRIIPGDDGREKLQTRVDLGLLQMELNGRPDGQRPHGFESLLEYHEHRRDQPEAGLGPFALEPTDCLDLMREGVQYYHRYLALFHLERFDLVAQDTGRNLRLFAFVVTHATRQRDKVQFDQYRPYVLMMHTRALGLQALARGDHRTVLKLIDEGIEGVLAFLSDYDQEDQEGQCQELGFLRRWRRQIDRERTKGPVERLEEQLNLAVAREQFEEAARLRDQIRRLREATAS